MFTAIVTAMLGTFWLARLGVLDLTRVYVPETFLAAAARRRDRLRRRVRAGRPVSGHIVRRGGDRTRRRPRRRGGMLSGVLTTGWRSIASSRSYESGARGSFTLPQLLHLPQGLVVCGIVAAALGGFWLTSLMERRPVVAHDTSLPAAGSKRQIGPNRLVLAAIAIALAVGVVFVGNPASASGAWSATSAPDPIERISAVQLAAVDQGPSAGPASDRRPIARRLRRYHVPTAERLPVDALRTLRPRTIKSLLCTATMMRRPPLREDHADRRAPICDDWRGRQLDQRSHEPHAGRGSVSGRSRRVRQDQRAEQVFWWHAARGRSRATVCGKAWDDVAGGPAGSAARMLTAQSRAAMVATFRDWPSGGVTSSV